MTGLAGAAPTEVLRLGSSIPKIGSGRGNNGIPRDGETWAVRSAEMADHFRLEVSLQAFDTALVTEA